MNYLFQETLPAKYFELSTDEMDQRITQLKKTLANKLLILGHHYQRDEVIKHADFRGDSLKLSQLAARERQAEYIVFCGVHFMAETADILTTPQQKVLLPDLNAGCSMANMAKLSQVEDCYNSLSLTYGKEIIPITYVNSTAEIKAFCGRNGGATCTSSNAKMVFDWACQENKIILFLPDEHLGRNTGLDMGILPEEMFLWQREEFDHDLPKAAPKLVLWNGFCSVHQKFTPQQISSVRSQFPGINVLVHPECDHSVVANSDLSGSTDFIIKTVNNSPVGSSWAIGTEINLVHRLAQSNPDKTIISLNPTVCVCVTMYRIDLPHLFWILDNLVQGKVVNHIIVEPDTARDAKIALDRMLQLSMQ